jgi:lysophospholipase L1-like esterase
MVAVLGGACSASRRTQGPPVSAEGNQPSRTVLALGGSATEGEGLTDRLHDAWPYRVFGTAFPRSTVFVNGALDEATAVQALAAQVPLARELKPDVVEVWLGADDVAARTPIDAFTSTLGQLVDELRAAGARRILVADLPHAYGVDAAPYNAALRRVVRDNRAELVDLANAPVRLVSGGGRRSQPDAVSHGVIADAFAAVLRSSP